MAVAIVSWTQAVSVDPVKLKITKNLTAPFRATLQVGATASLTHGSSVEVVFGDGNVYNGYEFFKITYEGDSVLRPVDIFEVPAITPSCGSPVIINSMSVTHGPCEVEGSHYHSFVPYFHVQKRCPRVYLDAGVATDESDPYPKVGKIFYRDALSTAFPEMSRLPRSVKMASESEGRCLGLLGWFTRPQGDKSAVQVFDDTRLLSTCNPEDRAEMDLSEEAMWELAKAKHSVDSEHFTLYAHWENRKLRCKKHTASCNLSLSKTEWEKS